MPQRGATSKVSLRHFGILFSATSTSTTASIARLTAVASPVATSLTSSVPTAKTSENRLKNAALSRRIIVVAGTDAVAERHGTNTLLDLGDASERPRRPPRTRSVAGTRQCSPWSRGRARAFGCRLSALIDQSQTSSSDKSTARDRVWQRARARAPSPQVRHGHELKNKQWREDRRQRRSRQRATSGWSSAGRKRMGRARTF